MPIVNGLITLDEAKRSIFNSATSTPSASDVADIEDLISAATPVIESLTGPMYVRNESFTFDGGGPNVILPVRFNSIVSVTEDGDSVTAYGDGPAGIVYAGTAAVPYDFADGHGNIVVTVSVGEETIPPNVKQATRELVRIWWQQSRQGSRPAFGEEATPVVTPQGFAIPWKVEQLCKPNPGQAGFA